MSATPELSQPRGPGRRFAPGRSGNPAGRPKGSRNKTTLLAEAMLAERLVKAGRVLDAGLAERQPWATRLVFNAFVPRPRAAGPEIDMPEIDGPADVAPASAAVLAAATSGLLTPTEAQAMHKVVEARAAMVGWAPPPPRPADAGRLTFGTISFRHTLPGDPGPLAFTVVDTVVRRDTDGSETRFRRVDTLTPAEIAAARASHRPDPDRPGGTWPPAESPAAEPAPALATDGAESPSDLAGETPAAPSLPADAPLSAPANAAGPEASNAAPVADTHTLPPEPARPAAPGAVPCIIRLP